MCVGFVLLVAVESGDLLLQLHRPPLTPLQHQNLPILLLQNTQQFTDHLITTLQFSLFTLIRFLILQKHTLLLTYSRVFLGNSFSECGLVAEGGEPRIQIENSFIPPLDPLCLQF